MDKIEVKKYIIIDDMTNARILINEIKINDITDLELIFFLASKITEYLLNVYDKNWNINFWCIQHLFAQQTTDQINCNYGNVYECYYRMIIVDNHVYNKCWNKCIAIWCDVCDKQQSIHICNGRNTIYQ